MTFAAPVYLFGTGVALVVAALLVIGGSFRGRSAAGRRFGEEARVVALFTADPAKRRAWKGVMLVLAVALAFVAAARPQYGKGTRLIPAADARCRHRARLLEEHVCARCRAVAHLPREGRNERDIRDIEGRAATA